MQIILMAGIIVESIFLSVLSWMKKLTRNAFMIITFATALCCTVLIGVRVVYGHENDITNQRENLYISMRLLEENYAKEAMNALSLVIDEQCREYQVEVIRGLILNQNEYYDTAVLYLENNTDELGEKVYRASLRKMLVEEPDKIEIIENVKSLVNASDDEARVWDAKMRMLYIGLDEENESEEKDIIVSVKMAIKDKRYREAYEMMQEAAENGGIREDIIVSNMYVGNYNFRTMEEDDYEYDELWNNVTQLQARLNQLSVELKEEEENQEVSTENEEAKTTDLQKEYSQVYAEYQLAWQDMTNEAVGRAINYMEYSRPDDYETNIAYQLQMSRLYFQCKQEDMAKECLNRIFAVEEIDREQWMGIDAYLLAESFMLYLSDANNTEYRDICAGMMNHLYQGVFEDEYYDGFIDFIAEYLRSLYGGIVINGISVQNYPAMSVSISSLDESLEIKKEKLMISDTGNDIADFQVTEEELNNLSICFVLDRSGSMSGTSMRDSKDAIQECIRSLDDFVKVALVSFENDAILECAVTDSKYLLLNKLEGIEADGGTSIVAGLEMAYNTLYGINGKKVIILLSDGYDSYADENALSDALNRLGAEGIETYTIGLDGCDERYLGRIADRTGGKFISVGNTGELDSIYREIQRSLLHVYTITYDNIDTEQEVRSFRIRYKDTLIQTKKNYITAEQEDIQENSVYQDFQDIQMSDYFKQTGGTGR